jgi:hypothetical protein
MQVQTTFDLITSQAWPLHFHLTKGQCIEGIGDPTERLVPLRNFRRKYGEGTDIYGLRSYNNFPRHILESKKFPLWSGHDIRTVIGTRERLTTYNDTPGHGKTAAYGVAYHLHNWFEDLEPVRRKYATYGHALREASTMQLSQIGNDLDLTVKCVHSLPNDINTGRHSYYEHVDGDVEAFWKKFGGPKPLYFRNETYIRERHAAVRRMVEADEKIHGSRYPLPSASM